MADKVDRATATMVRNLEEKTGKTLAEWVALARSLGEEKHAPLVKALQKHGLSYGYANLVAHSAAGA